MTRILLLTLILIINTTTLVVSQKNTLAIYPSEKKTSFDIVSISKNITDYISKYSNRFTVVKKPEEFVIATRISRDSIRDFNEMTKSGAQFILFFESSEFDNFKYHDTLFTTSKDGKVSKRVVFSPIVSLQTSYKLINISTGEIVSNFTRIFESNIIKAEDVVKSSYPELVNTAKGVCIGRLNSSCSDVLFQLENDVPFSIEIENIALEEKEKCKKVQVNQTKNSGIVKGMVFMVSYPKIYQNKEYWVTAATFKVKEIPEDVNTKVVCTVTDGEELLLKLLRDKSKIKITYEGIKRGLW